MKPFLNLKSVDETLALIFALKPLAVENVSLADACGRRLAAAFYAPGELPGFTRSAMDGYAVRARDVFGASESAPGLLRVAGHCGVGQMQAFSIQAGEAASILTGAPLPDGADAVIMVENTREAGQEQIEIIRSAAPGENVIASDEDAARGQELIHAGSLIRPQECGILAAFGITQIRVFRRPVVTIISTGDEVVPITSTPGPGQVRDVNSHSLAAFCKLRGAKPRLSGIVRDEPQELIARLRAAASNSDVILVSGGSSAGMRDHTVEAFLSLPDSRLLVHGVAIRPGKPFILAEAAGKTLIGLPGHVTSALVCAHVFLGPLLGRLQGESGPEPKPWIDATLSRAVASGQGRRDYIRCQLQKAGAQYLAVPLRGQSGVLSTLLGADGYVICPENSEGLRKDQQVKFYPFNS